MLNLLTVNVCQVGREKAQAAEWSLSLPRCLKIVGSDLSKMRGCWFSNINRLHKILAFETPFGRTKVMETHLCRMDVTST